MDNVLVAIQPYISIIKDLCTIVSLIIAAVVAIKGLQTWRHQLKGTAHYELAKRILKATYRLRDEIQSVRNPLMTEGEINHAVKEARLEINPSDDDYYVKSMAAVYYIRWKPVIDAYRTLELEAVEAEALWGPKAKEVIVPIKKSVNSLITAIDLVLRDLQPRGPRILNNLHRETFEKIMNGISSAPEEDQYLRELNSSVEAIEKIARPYIKR